MSLQLIMTGEINIFLLSIFIPVSTFVGGLVVWACMSFRYRRGISFQRQLDTSLHD